MTAQQKRRVTERARQNRSVDSIWFIIAGLGLVVVILTLFGWMDWSDLKPAPAETAPVNIEQAVETGGLVIEN